MLTPCPRCGMPPAWCLCADIPQVPSATEVLVLRHVKERCRSSNTGRLIPLAMPRATLWDHGVLGEPFDPACLEGPETWLLFSGDGVAERPTGRPERLVVLDGTWGQAARMARRLPGLAELPRLSLPPASQAPDRMRRPPRDNGMATLEALARAMALLEGPEVGGPLLALYDLHAARMWEMRGGRRARLNLG